jgi:4-hydroxy-3-methylbut-2-enyl diphosphate reductase
LLERTIVTELHASMTGTATENAVDLDECVGAHFFDDGAALSECSERSAHTPRVHQSGRGTGRLLFGATRNSNSSFGIEHAGGPQPLNQRVEIAKYVNAYATPEVVRVYEVQPQPLADKNEGRRRNDHLGLYRTGGGLRGDENHWRQAYVPTLSPASETNNEGERGLHVEKTAQRERYHSCTRASNLDRVLYSHAMSALPETYYRKGLGMKAEVQDDIAADYTGWVVDVLRERDFTLTVGDVTVRLAREFGFCYGVERAVEYAYQARKKFPERRIFLVGEIIHNPHVNDRLVQMGITILQPVKELPSGARFDYSGIGPADVVVLPAFGVTIRDFEALREIGCVMVDTTCGSVLNVWKRVESYAKDGFTALIHGKAAHEETRATASQVRRFADGHYLVVRDMEEARLVCDYVAGLGAGSVPADVASRFASRLGAAGSPGFDPEVHLRRIGVANQTTMLARESLAIAAEVGKTMSESFGTEYAAANFRTFDTICSAT